MSDPFAVAPPGVAASLRRLKDDLGRAAGANLAGLILYGGLARGRYRAGRSDVNVVVLLNDVSAGALAAVAPALRAARRETAVEPIILTPAEVPAVAHAFPTKFLDIKEHHVVLAGADPFASLEVPSEAIRRRVAQQLRNLSLRTRRRYLNTVGNPEAQAETLAGMARPLALEAAALLRLVGKPVPPEDRTAAIFEATP
ncbi:MAG TPA: hypothetical protein VKE94_15090 [Gemmataceae bacterium]|nr:hypothetical protein [Gemmataceae bacterium]